MGTCVGLLRLLGLAQAYSKGYTRCRCCAQQSIHLWPNNAERRTLLASRGVTVPSVLCPVIARSLYPMSCPTQAEPFNSACDTSSSASWRSSTPKVIDADGWGGVRLFRFDSEARRRPAEQIQKPHPGQGRSMGLSWTYSSCTWSGSMRRNTPCNICCLGKALA